MYKSFSGRRSQMTRAEWASFDLRKSYIVRGAVVERQMTRKSERLERHADIADWGGVGRGERSEKLKFDAVRGGQVPHAPPRWTTRGGRGEEASIRVA